MSEKIYYEQYKDDYVQSANSLFNFIRDPLFLKEFLLKKALIPKYDKENIKYLDLIVNGKSWEEIAVLQKCFCDIPFHKLTQKFWLKGWGEKYDNLNEGIKRHISENNTHTDFYGRYGIAFSKNWGEENGLQPIYYLNGNSDYTKEFSRLINTILEEEETDSLVEEDILSRLAFIKPIRGIMKKKVIVDEDTGKEDEIDFIKNFHDEKEWRYVPSLDVLKNMKMSALLANPNEIKHLDGDKHGINFNLRNERCSSTWLKFKYEDIRYLLVPDINARLDIIKTIRNIPDSNFESSVDIQNQKDVLISKILVLDEMEKDV